MFDVVIGVVLVLVLVVARSWSCSSILVCLRALMFVRLWPFVIVPDGVGIGDGVGGGIVVGIVLVLVLVHSLVGLFVVLLADVCPLWPFVVVLGGVGILL